MAVSSLAQAYLKIEVSWRSLSDLPRRSAALGVLSNSLGREDRLLFNKGRSLTGIYTRYGN